MALSALSILYTQQNSILNDKNNQIVSLQKQLNEPNLESIGFQYTDNRSNTNSPFLQITGYVVNVGSITANNCKVNVKALQDGNITALDTNATINSLNAGAFETINLQFPYTGQALESYTNYLTWTN